MARIAIQAGLSGTSLTDQITRFGAGALQSVEAALEGVRAAALPELRQEIGQAFPRSRRMPTTITAKLYPAREGKPDPVVWIHPRAGSNIGQVLEAHRGTTIRGQGGKLLAIPLRGVPRSGNDGRRRQMSPEEYAAAFGPLQFVPSKTSAAAGYLVARRKPGRDFEAAASRRARGARARRTPAKRYEVLFVLVREVVLPARLKPEVILDRQVAQLPELVDRAARVLGLGA